MTSLIKPDLLESVIFDAKNQQDRNIFRAPHNKENPYTLISNKVLRDTNIRHSDRGLLCQLLSWSDAHRLCIQALVKKSIEGRDAIRNSIDRLIAQGYIIMTRQKTSTGKFDSVSYKIFEEPKGKPKAEIDLSGIVEDDGGWSQLDLFASEDTDVIVMEIDGEKKEQQVQAVDGFSVSGKHDTNNNYDSRNNINTNNSDLDEIPMKDGKVDQGALLRRFSLKIDDPQLKAKIGIAGLSTFLTNQEQLDRFLIDFNQQHLTYAHLNNSKRLHNFVAYLVRIKSTPHYYKMHVTRMKALGVNLTLPDYKSNRPEAKPSGKNKIEKQQTGCNPFPVTEEKQPIVLSASYIESLDGF